MTDADIERHIEAMLTGKASHLHSNAVQLAISYRQLKATEALLEQKAPKHAEPITPPSGLTADPVPGQPAQA
jgi:hypothetical protein